MKRSETPHKKMLKELLLNRGSESKQTSTSSSAVESETPTPPEVYDTIQSIDVETPEYVGRQIAAMGPTVIQPGISHTLHEIYQRVQNADLVRVCCEWGPIVLYN